MPVFKLLANSEDDKEVKEINALLQKYNDKYPKTTKTDLQNIIEACNEYIAKIPEEKRKRDFKTIPWNIQLSKWPQPEEVLNIQKKAVSFLYLPEEAPNHAKARWNLLKHFFIPQQSKDAKAHYPVKHMDFKYFSEYYYHGNTDVGNWINFSNCDLYELQSFRELQEKSKKYSVNICALPHYLKSAELQKVTVGKDGLLYFKNKPLNTETSSDIHNFFEAVLYVADMAGNIYINNPEKKQVSSELRHSIFLRGTPAMCAGVIKVVNGQIISISNRSGHYQPTTQNLLNFVLLLNKLGINLEKVRIIDECQKPRSKHGIGQFLTSVPPEDFKKAQRIFLSEGKEQQRHKVISSSSSATSTTTSASPSNPPDTTILTSTSSSTTVSTLTMIPRKRKSGQGIININSLTETKSRPPSKLFKT